MKNQPQLVHLISRLQNPEVKTPVKVKIIKVKKEKTRIHKPNLIILNKIKIQMIKKNLKKKSNMHQIKLKN